MKMRLQLDYSFLTSRFDKSSKNWFKKLKNYNINTDFKVSYLYLTMSIFKMKSVKKMAYFTKPSTITTYLRHYIIIFFSNTMYKSLKY